MAQSPLSQAIRQLEPQVGAAAVRRAPPAGSSSRRAGEAFLREAQRILEAVDAARVRGVR